MKRKTLQERFWERVQYLPSGCWEWTRQLNNKGYGQFWIRHKAYLCHRMAYQDLAGPIPEGLELDHLCRNTKCLNPAHLEPVTHRENIRRGKAATKMACKLGHDWTNPYNVYIRHTGVRWCAECMRTRWYRPVKVDLRRLRFRSDSVARRQRKAEIRRRETE